MKTIIDDANHISALRLIETHLKDAPRYATAIYSGVVITIEPTRRRTGLPEDAVCTRYLITHVDAGWSMRVRSAWLDGKILSPAATHLQIEQYHDDQARYGTDEGGVAIAVNEWFRGLHL